MAVPSLAFQYVDALRQDCTRVVDDRLHPYEPNKSDTRQPPFFAPAHHGRLQAKHDCSTAPTLSLLFHRVHAEPRLITNAFYAVDGNLSFGMRSQ